MARRKQKTEKQWSVECGDSLVRLKSMADASCDSMLTDPPAGIGFQSKNWDKDKGGRDNWIAWLASIMREAHRVLKPGSYALVWALPRTQHWTQTACEDAGFEIRDVISHQFGSGFPKNKDISKAIDKAAGAERKVVGTRKLGGNAAQSTAEKGGTYATNTDSRGVAAINVPITEPATDAAKRWDGWGTALRPSHESWILIRKPAQGTLASNVSEHGVGGINVDGCRIGEAGSKTAAPKSGKGQATRWITSGAHMGGDDSKARWPPNVVYTHSAACAEQCAEDCPVAELARQSGERPGMSGGGQHAPGYTDGMFGAIDSVGTARNDGGSAARFFPLFRYSIKPGTSERDAGLDTFEVLTGGQATDRKDGSAGTKSPRAGAGRKGGRRNGHPTVKSLSLMRWFCRLVTPPGGIVLDPFAGSGSTGIGAVLEGFQFRGIELDEYHTDIARARIAHIAGDDWEALTERAVAVDPVQGDLFKAKPKVRKKRKRGGK